VEEEKSDGMELVPTSCVQRDGLAIASRLMSYDTRVLTHADYISNFTTN
jgi:hypothetical protein